MDILKRGFKYDFWKQCRPLPALFKKKGRKWTARKNERKRNRNVEV
jgi:hypothetical protein